MNPNNIRIKSELWRQTWEGLSERSRGQIESLCIWAGRRTHESSEVTEVIFLDGIGGVEGFALFHRITREAVGEIFAILKDKGLQIIADVHTHPEEWVGLSRTDREHPLEYRIGFVSIVLPHFGRAEHNKSGIGMHRYKGNHQWHELSLSEKSESLKLED